MVLPLLFLLGQAQVEPAGKMYDLTNPFGGSPRARVIESFERMPISKVAPKDPTWQYDWASSGFGKVPGDETFRLRTLVYSQKARDDHRADVARLAMRLWELNMTRLFVDNPSEYGKVVTFYLSFGGEAGGEQMFAVDPQIQQISPGRSAKVNTVYLYDIASFKGPVQMAREVAHEYGHATLPAIGLYAAPEKWASGYLGERLYLRWIRDLMASGKLAPEDAMGATLDGLDGWVKGHCDPLEDRIATKGPDSALLAKDSSDAMDEFLGLALYTARLLGPTDLQKSYKLNATNSGLGYLKGLKELISARESLVYELPSSWQGRDVYLPTEGKPVKGAEVLLQRDGWTKVRLTTTRITLG
ncbi:MAG: hypothetical protein KIS66_08040 [Fimbriimonadaceae bacterium]|nr:hypothetical protein [Fimbriimonadaceae bacterium]